jgi:hypothetical protein
LPSHCQKSQCMAQLMTDGLPAENIIPIGARV